MEVVRRVLKISTGGVDGRDVDERLRDYAIAQIRVHGVMAQKEFAALAGRGEDWASKYLDRKAPAGSLETSVRIAMALGLNLRQLTGLEEYPSPTPALKWLKPLHRVWSQIPDTRKPRALAFLRGVAAETPPAPPEED